MVNPKKKKAREMRSLAWLGLLLQGLGALFGVTALIGMLICATRLKDAKGSIYYSHLQWQIVTFWIAVIAGAASYYVYNQFGATWPMILAGLLIIYRLLTSLFMLIENQPIKRWL